MQLTFAADITRLRLDMERERARLARVTRRVVNAAAYGALDDVRAEMNKVFDRPTPWVINGPYVVPARDGDQFNGTEARVAWREFGGKGVPAEKILNAQIEGGQRRLKKFERLIGLPPNRVAVPGKWAPIDAYGNLSGPFIVQVLSDLRLFGETGYIANRVSKRDAKRRPGARPRAARFFIIRPGSEDRQLPPGIYRNTRGTGLYGAGSNGGKAPLLVIAFVRAANYRARFAPARVVAESVNANLPRLWEQGLAGSLPFRSARS
jgi:hypothetical protein